MRIHRLITSVLLALIGLHAQVITAAEQLTLATWNAGMFDRPVSALDLSGYAAEVHPDILVLNEVLRIEDVQAIRNGLGREDDFIAITSFENGVSNLEVAIISRFPLTDVVEFDPFPEPGQTVPEQRKLEHLNLAGVPDVNTDRGFLVARIPSLNMFVIAAHLKSSRGASGNSDKSNAEKRELVAAAIADHVNKLMEDFPLATVAVMGDFNVGVSDAKKNGTDLLEDDTMGSGDKYDETHALLMGGLVDGLRMKSLAKDLDGTFVGSDDVADFPGTGAIDVIYVVGPGAEAFAPAKRASTRFGSDHRSVFTTSAAALPSAKIAIKKLLPNPNGTDAGNESITVENTGTAFAANGWRFRDNDGNTFSIPSGTQLVQGLTVIKLTLNTMPLNNTGDKILLLNDAGAQVGDQFSYTKAEVISGKEIVH